MNIIMNSIAKKSRSRFQPDHLTGLRYITNSKERGPVRHKNLDFSASIFEEDKGPLYDDLALKPDHFNAKKVA